MSRTPRLSKVSKVSQSTVAAPKVQRRCKKIEDYGAGSGSSSENSDEDEYAPSFVKDEQAPKKSTAMEIDLWATLKAFKSLKTSDQSITAICLGIISSQDLSIDFNVDIICQQHNLELLINILDTDDRKCRNGSLMILKEVSKRQIVAALVTKMGIAEPLTKLMYDISPTTNALAAETISSIGWRRPATRALRHCGAITVLIARLKIKKDMLWFTGSDGTPPDKKDVKVIKWSSYALWSMSKFKKNKLKMLESGVIPLLINVITSGNRDVLLPTVGLLSDCSTHPMFQVAIMDKAIVGVLVEGCETEDPEMQKLCALALSRAAGDNDTVREMIRFHRGPSVIMGLLMETDMSNHRMLTAALTAMWKSALNTDIAEEYQRLGAADLLVELLNDTDMDVLIAAVGAIGEIAKCDEARLQFISKGAMTEIIKLLGHINVELLVNSARAVGILSDCDEGIAMLDESDGLRLLWSLLKNKSQKVKVEALWAVKPCVTRHPDSGELIRSLMDSLNLLVKMIKQEKNREVLTAVAAVISQVAMDLENLGVMTEQGVVKHLSALVLREPRDAQIEEAEKLERRSTGLWFKVVNIRTKLHCELSSAVANCATLPENRRAFGCAGVIRVIVDYMHTQNAELLAQACRALHVLSQDNFNCVSIQSCGAVPLLLIAIESKCMVTQIGAAGTLKNIRLMLERSDAKRMVFDCMPRDERQKKLKEIEAIVHVISGHHEPDEHKDLILKGHPRSSIDATHLLLNKLHGKAPSEHAIHSFMKKQQQEAALVKKQGSFLSWRERLSLMSLVDRNEKKDFRRSSERSFILSTAAATEKLPKVVIKTRRFSN